MLGSYILVWNILSFQRVFRLMHLRLFPAKQTPLSYGLGIWRYTAWIWNAWTIISRLFCSWCIRSSTFETYLEEEILQQAGKKLFSFCWSCFVRLGRARDTNFVSGVSRQWNRMRLSYRIYQFCGTSKNIMTHKICDFGNVCIQAIWLWDIFASLYSKLVVQVTRV